MKKYICVIMAFLLCLAFAACTTEKPDDPISSDVESIQDTESKAQQNEPASQNVESTAISSDNESTDEQSEQSKEGTVSEPFLSIDPESFPYRTLYASNAKEMAEKLIALKSKLADDDMQKFDPAKPDYFANLDKMLADGYIFNPSYDGIYADTDYDRTIEATFWEDKTAVIWYHITVDNTRIDIQISYLNNEIEQLIDQYGIDGYRIYFSEDKKPLSEYSVAEKASLGYKSVSVIDQEICGKTVPSIRYLEDASDKSNIVSLLYDNKVISVIYCCYDDETTTTLPAIEDIVKEIRLETVNLK